MPQFPILLSGQQEVTDAAVALPNVPASAGDGFQVNLEALKANTGIVYYGPPDVTTMTGKELPPGTTDTLFVDNLDMINVIASAASGNYVSWSVTAIG